MQLYAIRRRKGWKTPEELKQAAGVSSSVGNEMADKLRWIRSYVVVEDSGELGTVCIYQAVSPEAIKEHADRVGMPADEITMIADTVIVRPDPVAVPAE